MMEVGVHGPLSRSHTASIQSSHSRLHSSGGPTPLMPNSNHASFSTFSSRASDSSQGTSASTLFAAQPPPPLPSHGPLNGGPVEAANNVLNKRGDKEASLFVICQNLSRRLRNVPGFEEVLLEEERSADEDTDPVTLLWRTFRRGYPLMIIYNALEPPVKLEVDKNKVSEKKREQAATYKFLSACINQLKFPSEDCFVISDLYSDDTTGFVKVVKVVNRVLDLLVQKGLINDAPPDEGSADPAPSNIKRTQRQHIVDELVKTERTYVQHLELLQAFKKLVEEKGVVTGDAVHAIFLNLNALLDFQRRFLIRVEQTNAQPESEQNWGRLFVLYKEAFKVYEPFIANQKRCEETAMLEFEKLRETGGPPELRQMVESPTHLTSFLLKPFQRLSKYPLLLKELRDKGDLDEERRDDISTGIDAASAVLKRTNEAVDMEDRKEALEELKSRVEDWKGHRIEGFGDLLLYGTFTVLKGDGGSKDQEREYKIYLFEMILLCCKEINPNKQKNKLMSKGQLYDKKGKPKLQLKGRIFMQNVTDAISTSKPGSYTCQIFWKGDPGIENFVIRFATEDTLRKWVHQVDQQRRQFRDTTQRASGSTKQSTTSATEFTYIRDLQGQGPIQNPYAEADEDDDEVDVAEVTSGYPGQTDFTLAQGEKGTRSRSTTGESGVNPLDTSRPPDLRTLPPRFPHGSIQNPPLSLRTQQLQAGAISPGNGPNDSYFSPSIESPISTRTSSSSSMFPFPRQHMSNGWHGDDNVRFTAPAIGRHTSRDASSGSHIYSNGRGPVGRPSVAPTVSQNAINSQIRLRSASSPDIHNHLPTRRTPGGSVPDVPPFPSHYAYPGHVNRSQSNSPNIPTPTSMPRQSSPNIQREKQALRTPGSEINLHLDYPDSSRQDSRFTPGSSRTATPASSFEQQRTTTPGTDRPLSPTLPAATPTEVSIPSQLKVKVHCPSAGSTMTLVVSTNISFQSLKDRIDAKLQRSTNVSLSSGQVKLKYIDDDDYVSIQSDEDVQMAFETWKEQQRDQLLAGQLGEIELFCQ
ncbi:Pleckstrin homology domain-containing protein [Phyllosticta capitalensis]|uniref:Pleckstrin homology domain-containing protein n=2 Tax=Phyllosticta capitalensis TaxID=121624 RepID=A0ABR1YS05_9PEZI